MTKSRQPKDNKLVYKDFIGSVSFSAEDNVFWGKIEGIDDLVTFESDNVEGLKQEFQEAVNDYIETCKEIGKPLFKSCKGSFNVRIPEELHLQAVKISHLLNISLNKLVQNALEKEVENYSKEH
jgi:predicted HicB family RNase H-like nuclease